MLNLSTLQTLMPGSQRQLIDQASLTPTNDAMGFHLERLGNEGKLLRCSNPECSFICTSQDQFQAHVSSAHVRHIRRAVKPSQRSKGPDSSNANDSMADLGALPKTRINSSFPTFHLTPASLCPQIHRLCRHLPSPSWPNT